MTGPISRRQALTALGTVSLGTIIAACSKDGSGDSAATTTAEVSTTDGSTTTVRPQTSTGSVTADLFDDAASCTLTPEMTEGPFYFDVDSVRSDIREDREGTTLRLAVRVRDAAACAALADAVVDIWHCDALGSYSGFEDADDETYLRGAQVTNADGIVEFVTVYPGWYPGRTPHIHAKVHIDNSTVLTTQLYFDEDVTDAVYAAEPYASDGGRDTSNADDSIFDDSLVLTLSEDGDGYLGLITVDVDA